MNYLQIFLFEINTWLYILWPLCMHCFCYFDFWSLSAIYMSLMFMYLLVCKVYWWLQLFTTRIHLNLTAPFLLWLYQAVFSLCLLCLRMFLYVLLWHINFCLAHVWKLITEPYGTRAITYTTYCSYSHQYELIHSHRQIHIVGPQYSSFVCFIW